MKPLLKPKEQKQSLRDQELRAEMWANAEWTQERADLKRKREQTEPTEPNRPNIYD